MRPAAGRLHRFEEAAMGDVNTPVRITFDRLHCRRPAGGTGGDDLYVVFAAVDLSPALISVGRVPVGVPLPRLSVQVTEVHRMGEGDTRRQGQGQATTDPPLGTLWPVGGRGAAPLRRPEDLILLVALMASDSGPAGALGVRSAAQATLSAAVAGRHDADLSRPDLAETLGRGLFAGIGAGARPGFIPFYDACLDLGEFPLARRRPDGRSRLEAGRDAPVVERIRLGRGPGTAVRGRDRSPGAVYDVHLRISPVRP
jgi:hypothetical protein